MPAKPDGHLTAEITERLADYYCGEGCEVFHDHGDQAERGTIVSCFEDQPGKQLSHVDIVVVRKASRTVIALLEIEENSDKPKILLGDAFSILMGESIYHKGETLKVDERTVLIVAGVGKADHKARNDYLRARITEAKASLRTSNARLGKVEIKTYKDRQDLLNCLPSRLGELILR